MTGKNVRYTLLVFFFGLAVGGFFAVTVVREAVPLKSHVWMIGLSVLFGGPIVLIIVFWYMRLMGSVKQILGQKGGDIVSQILSFQIVSMVLIVLILISVLYAAIA